MPIENGSFVLRASELIPNDWKFLYDSYTGLGGYKDGSYLVQHKRESDEKLQRRKALAIYPNYVKKIVDTFTAHMFRKSPQRETTPEYETFINDTDRRGTYIDDFMRRLFKLCMIYGTVFVVVDKPSAEARTRGEEIQMGLLPYATVRLPSQIESYELDEFGNLQSITFAEAGKEKRYRYFDAESWKVLNAKKEVIAQGQHNLGTIPVVRASLTEQLLYEEVLSEPFIWNIAKLNFEIYNLISEIREILRNLTFPVLTYPVRDSQEEQRLKQGLLLGTENALLYNPEGGGKPDFIAPPSAPVEVYMEYLKLTIEQIYKSVNLEFALGTQTGKSGVALEFEFQNLNSMLVQFALALEQTEYQIARLVARWNGREEFEGKVSYAKDYSYRDLERELKISMDALTLSISSTFEKELKKKLSRAILTDWSDDNTLTQIDKEIDGIEGRDNQLANE